ncbi:omwaprin-a-like [Aquarana catesbeiana]|uniref:omwaprin-a-like n=1 Tax=Aquarana catesbeiana TaxID=8400 RepID=UPI003CC9802F
MKATVIAFTILLGMVLLQDVTDAAMPPPAVKPGTCPMVKKPAKCMRPMNKCKVDSDCPGTKKCCDVGCYFDCKEPTK